MQSNSIDVWFILYKRKRVMLLFVHSAYRLQCHLLCVFCPRTLYKTQTHYIITKAQSVYNRANAVVDVHQFLENSNDVQTNFNHKRVSDVTHRS